MAVEDESAMEQVPAVAHLKRSMGMVRIEEHAAWTLIAQLPVVLSVRIKMTHFKTGQLVELKVGQVITSDFSHTSDVPLLVGAVRLGWSEFEVAGECVAVRLTQLA